MMKYCYRYTFYCLLLAISFVLFCPSVSAQGRFDKIRKRYSHLIEKADKAYYNYDFELAESSVQQYQNKLKQRRVPLDSLTLIFLEKVKRAKQTLAYAEAIQLVDSIQFSRKDIEKVFRQRSPMLANILSFKLDSSQFEVFYKTDIGGFMLYTNEDNKNRDLYRRELLVQESEKAQKLSVSTDENEFNPFLLSSGYTLIFARQSKQGIGGADLYYTRYNTEAKTFYKAKMFGMPFTSVYNDYLLAYDDKQNLSYLVSDRFCPSDSLVLYRFVGLPKSIADNSNTAGASINENEKVDGLFLKSLDTTYRMPTLKKTSSIGIHLPLKSGIVLRSWESFRSAEALSYYRDYIAFQKQIKEKKAYQKELRKRYKEGVLITNEELEALEEEIRQLNKQLKSALIECKNAEIRHREL